LLDMPLSPCRRYHHAGVSRRFSQYATTHAVFVLNNRIDLRGLFVSRLPLRSHLLRPSDLLTIPRMALSMGFRNLVSLLPAIQATRPLALTLGGLTPPEHAGLLWTHCPPDGYG
jgi:hypothetical protein